ncbi:hypothetical protein ISS30_06210 [bacterium]|nr:hypothetical protein [bacterium]
MEIVSRAAATGCPKILKCHSGTLKAYPESTVIYIKYKQLVSTAESRHHTILLFFSILGQAECVCPSFKNFLEG